MRPRLELAAVLIILAAVGANAYLGLHGESRQSRDEKRTCTIQSVGLAAQRHLTQVLAAFNVFLQPPPTGVVKAKQPPVPAYYEYSLKAVRYHLPLYLQLEREQPASRRC